MQKWKAVTFDLDGTLMHSENLILSGEFILEFLKIFAARFGWLKSTLLLRQVRSSLKPPAFGETRTNEKRILNMMCEVLNLSSEQEAREIYTSSLMQIFQKLSPHFDTNEDALELMNHWDGRYRRILATNPVWPRPITLFRMDKGEIKPEWLESITTAENYTTMKPDVRYYQEILNHHHLGPGEVLHVGNSIKMDGAARNVGMAVFIVDEYATRLLTVPPTKPLQGPLWIGNWPDLIEILK